MIDPNIWQSEDFSKLSTLSKLVFIGLFSLADDEGKGRCNPVYLRSTLFPYDEGIRSTDIDKTLSEISSNMSILFYSCNGSNYYRLTNWNIWQKIDRPSDSKIPNYDENSMNLLFDDNSTNVRRAVVPNKNRIRIEDNIKENKENINKNVHEIVNESCTNESFKKTMLNFIEMRKKIGKPITSNAVKLLLNKLSKMGDIDYQIKILEQSIMNSWTGVYEVKQNNIKNVNSSDVLKEAYIKAKKQEGDDPFETND